VKRTALACLFALVLPVVAAATPAAASTVVSPTLDVTADVWANNEESLGMDPTGTLLAGAWNDWEYNDGCGFSYSTDGGATWAPESFVPGLTQFTNDPDIPGTGRFIVAGDPAVTFNPKSGVFDIICQSFGTKSGNQVQMLSTTFDPDKADPQANENDSYGAAAWTTPTVVPASVSNGGFKGSNGAFPDHEQIIVDTVDAPGHHYGRLYVVWAQFSGSGRSPIDVSYSDDDGATWTGPIRVSDVPHKFDQDANASIAPNGDVYVTFITGPNEKSLKKNYVAVVKSTDGGSTWSPTALAAPIPGAYGDIANADYRGFSDVRSTVDQASGKLVITFSDTSSGAANIWSTHQTAAGSLSDWSTPVRINPSPNWQFFPWMASAPNGRVDVVYYDRTCDAADKLICVTLSSTNDSGATWSHTSLLGSGFDGDHFSTCLAFIQEPDCGRHFIGDYIAVASTNDKAQVLYTGNGADALDVFSVSASF
jgi:hypothetical protein